MKKALLIMITAAAIFLPAIAANAQEHEILVVSKKPINKIIEKEDELIKSSHPGDYLSAIKVDEDKKDAIETYNEKPGVIIAAENVKAELASTTALSMYDMAFEKTLNNAAKYMEALTGLSRISVAVIDPEFDLSNQDLTFNVKESRTVIGKSVRDFTVTKKAPHGSDVASIIGATRNNGIGIDGIASINKKANLNLCLYCEKDNDLYAMAAALQDAAERKIHVICMPLCFKDAYPYTKEVLDYHLEKITRAGGIPVASAGNYAGHTPNNYPAASPYCIGVIGSDIGVKAPDSSYGSAYNLSAPFYVNVPAGKGVKCKFGTSYSAPIAASAAAYLKMINPSLSFDQVKNILEGTATDIGPKGRDMYTGAGKVNLLAAAQRAASTNGSVKIKTRPIYEFKKGKIYRYSKAAKIKGWSRKRVAFRSPDYGSCVYKFYNKKTKAYRYSRKNKLSGWQKTGIAFYAGGSNKVYQAYNKKAKTYYYTKNYNQYKRLNKKIWKKQGSAFACY